MDKEIPDRSKANSGQEDGIAGYYGGSTPAGNVKVANMSRDSLLNSIDEIKKHMCNSEVFTFCDFGTGNGVASIQLIYDCVEKIKKVLGNEQEIHIVYEDQAENEFKEIFTTLKEANSFQSDFSKVYVSTVGRTYFEQCLPSNSLHLGFSVMCMHWLSIKPCEITNGVEHHQITIEAERNAYKAQAAKDWVQLLLKRAAEMKNGARFLSVQVCTDEDGSYAGHTVNEGSIYECMQTCLDTMVKHGRITPEESRNSSFALYNRTLDEYAAPFLDENSSVRKAGLNLISIKAVRVACKHREEWLSNPTNPNLFARKLVQVEIRPWTNYTFLAGLSENRALEERRGIVDEFYEYLVREVEKCPSSYALNHIHAHVLFEKVTD